MPVITENFKKLDKVAPSRLAVGTVYFTVSELRYVTADNFVVVPVRVECALVGGVLTTPNLAAGPAIVELGLSGPTYKIEIPAVAGPVKLWPLIDAGMPTPVNAAGFVRNAGGIARVARTTTGDYAAMPTPDPETLYIEFEN